MAPCCVSNGAATWTHSATVARGVVPPPTAAADVTAIVGGVVPSGPVDAALPDDAAAGDGSDEFTTRDAGAAFFAVRTALADLEVSLNLPAPTHSCTGTRGEAGSAVTALPAFG